MKKSLIACFALAAVAASAAVAQAPPMNASTIDAYATTAVTTRADHQAPNQSTASTVSVAADKVVVASAKKAGTERMQTKKHVAPTAKMKMMNRHGGGSGWDTAGTEQKSTASTVSVAAGKVFGDVDPIRLNASSAAA